MGRRPCCEKVGLNRGPWTLDEDLKLTNFILNHGIHCWRLVPKLAGLQRCGKSCRLRWVNYLRPDLKRGAISESEEDLIIQLHSCFGNRWSKIAEHFPGRTDNEIKNHWNTRIKKKLKRDMHINPVEDEQPKNMFNQNHTTPETDDFFWKSFEEELITCSSHTDFDYQIMGSSIQEEDVQNWIGSLTECLLSSDAMHHNNS